MQSGGVLNENFTDLHFWPPIIAFVLERKYNWQYTVFLLGFYSTEGGCALWASKMPFVVRYKSKIVHFASPCPSLLLGNHLKYLTWNVMNLFMHSSETRTLILQYTFTNYYNWVCQTQLKSCAFVHADSRVCIPRYDAVNWKAAVIQFAET